jgi:hypothetical protein
MLADGKLPVQIAKTVDCTTNYVHKIRAFSKNRKSQKHRNPYFAAYHRARQASDPAYRKNRRKSGRKHYAKTMRDPKLAEKRRRYSRQYMRKYRAEARGLAT